jgi:hypothetical protein
MQRSDFTKLLGFATVVGADDKLDLHDNAVRDKLGARIGAPTPPDDGVEPQIPPKFPGRRRTDP